MKRKLFVLRSIKTQKCLSLREHLFHLNQKVSLFSYRWFLAIYMTVCPPYSGDWGKLCLRQKLDYDESSQDIKAKIMIY